MRRTQADLAARQGQQLVMTRFPVPEPTGATATNKGELPGAPEVTKSQLLSDAEARMAQLIPSGLVMTRLPVPEFETATNKGEPPGVP
jgi:hypothetical protein